MAVKFNLFLPRTGSSGPLPNGLELRAPNAVGTVILIHGLTGTPNEMKYLATYLNRRGYTTVCPRLAHHGEPIQILKRAKWREFYDSVREAFLKVSLEEPGDIFTAGLSMGALLALLLAEEFPGRVKGVSCLSPTLFYDGWNIPWTQRLLPLAYYTPIRHFAYFKEEPPYGIKNEAVRRKVHEYYRKATLTDGSQVAKYGYPYFPVTLFCEMRRLISHLKKKLPGIMTPVQLIQAKDDDMTSVKNSEYIYGRIGSHTKKIELLYDSYHVITADQERETVASKMYEFFTGVQNLRQPEACCGKGTR